MRTQSFGTIAVAAATLILLGAGCGKAEPPAPTASTSTPLTESPQGSAPGQPAIGIPSQALVGTWVSDCLVPDLNSDWSERHTFTFDPSGTAGYVRDIGYNHSCSGDRNVMSYRYLVPMEGQIDLSDLDSGATMYDTYAMSGATLKLGHGFRNKFAYPGATGDSPASRIPTLNDYIVYTRK
ncbi:MAG: hypothetical protein Q7S02_00705 [bacterium]|nr:hypothetical protein [bacterium]